MADGRQRRAAGRRQVEHAQRLQVNEEREAPGSRAGAPRLHGCHAEQVGAEVLGADGCERLVGAVLDHRQLAGAEHEAHLVGTVAQAHMRIGCTCMACLSNSEHAPKLHAAVSCTAAAQHASGALLCLHLKQIEADQKAVPAATLSLSK